jgi:hypothetical protein
LNLFGGDFDLQLTPPSVAIASCLPVVGALQDTSGSADCIQVPIRRVCFRQALQ